MCTPKFVLLKVDIENSIQNQKKKQRYSKQETGYKRDMAQHNETNLNSRLQERGLQLYHVLNDNNCLFRSLAYMLALGEDQHLIIRRLLVAYIRNNRTKFEDRIQVADTFEEYCNGMQESGRQGDDLVLQAAADIFGLNIVLLHSTAEEETIIPAASRRDTIHLTYNPEFYYHATSPVARTNPLLPPWTTGFMLEEVQRGSKCTGQWHLLVYEKPIIKWNTIVAAEFNKSVLDALKREIPIRLNSQLSRFFAYDEGRYVYVIIVIDFSHDQYGNKRQNPNRRFTFGNQLDVESERADGILGARIYKFEGHPHPEFVEWNITTRMPLLNWDPIDHRSRRPAVIA